MTGIIQVQNLQCFVFTWNCLYVYKLPSVQEKKDVKKNGCDFKFSLQKNCLTTFDFCVNLKYMTHYSVCKWLSELEKDENIKMQ